MIRTLRASRQVTLVAALVCAAAACHVAGATEPPPPALDEAVAEARASHEALIVEFSTVWCGPCKTLEEKILPDAEVKAALADVHFVRYDAEKGPGKAAAARLAVEGFPTLVAVNPEGHAADKIVGLRSAPELAAWVRGVADKVRAPLSSLLEASRTRPKDARLQLKIARRYLESGVAGDRKLARLWLVRAVASAAKGSVEAEDSEWERARLDIVDGERGVRAKLARPYLERHSTGPHALEAAQAYALGAPPHAEAEKVFKVVVAAPADAARRTALVLAALRAGATDAALAGAELLVDKSERSAATLSLLAEVRHQRGENELALKLVEEARALTPQAMRFRFDLPAARYKVGGTDPGDTLRIADPIASAPPPVRPPPSDPAADAQQARTAQFRQMVARVSHACANFARSQGVRRVWVRVELADQRVRRVIMLEPSLPVLLEACIDGELMGGPFLHPVDGEDTFSILF